MNRRTFLKSSAGAFVGMVLAGCSSQQSNSKVRNFEFSLVNRDESLEKPKITYLTGDTIVIEGTVTVSNGCKTLVIGSEPNFTEENELQFSVISHNQNKDKMCTMALEDISYRLRIKYEGRTPHLVSVQENGVESNAYEVKTSTVV